MKLLRLNRVTKYSLSMLVVFMISGSCKFSMKENSEPLVEANVSLISKIYSSSFLKNGNYNANNLIDRKASSWCEGVSDDGKGEVVSIEFKSSVHLSDFWIYNGFHNRKHWVANNRVKEVEITLFNGSKFVHGKVIELDDEVENKISANYIADKINFRIISTYSGYRDNDTCLNEISFENISKKILRSESCIIEMQWVALDGIPRPDWFSTACLNRDAEHCENSMGYEHSPNKSCADKGYKFICRYSKSKYSIQKKSECPYYYNGAELIRL
ncbi:hypothetical protein L9Z41_02240 [Leptospira noguchii]|uniref:NADase-type glycan-binding domain-containing protein n=1 Tax=Leptospira noguchii TaxID=28182 RepID=UPI001F06B240|nr:hypothetical protein [Leptospira noguchii]MCH1911448.1 hypothetical protein [Leptospira noguchii]MCH1914502.1 hypothetical protein [Leptospira noguchii]UOG64451.1 hypothetical protein MAL04_02265 [Leptospira noguchii]